MSRPIIGTSAESPNTRATAAAAAAAHACGRHEVDTAPDGARIASPANSSGTDSRTVPPLPYQPERDVRRLSRKVKPSPTIPRSAMVMRASTPIR